MFDSNDDSRSLFRDEQSLLTNPVTWAVAGIIVLASGAWYYYTHRKSPPPPPPPVVQQNKPAEQAPPEPAIRNPIPSLPAEAGNTAEPLPALNDSDAAAQTSLAGAIGNSSVQEFLTPQGVIRNIVVTIDNLPRKKVAVERRPIKATPGQPTVTGAGDTVTLSPETYARYAPFIQLIQNTDTVKLTDFYFRFYPLFQQAYEDLGYPNAYFNDRVIEVIDHLLQTPDVRGPIELVQPKVFYEFVDPKLEGRSAGQKTLIRMGPENAAALKKKLREIRAQIVGRA